MGKIPSCKSLSTLGDRSFKMAAPKLWNDLPLFMRNISSVNAFKEALKTHLFKRRLPANLLFLFFFFLRRICK